MATVTTPMQKLERRLAHSGFPKKLVRAITPVWWDDSLEKSTQSMLLLKMHLSKHLGLDLASLVDDSSKVCFVANSPTHYRLTRGKSGKDVVVSKSLSESMARLIAAAALIPYTPIPEDPECMRQEILASTSTPWVSLEALIEYLWEHGIPVLHIKGLPSTVKKFDGMVVDVDGRPVVILARGNQAPAWQLFILAHEAGHIGRGHVESGTVFFDEKVEDSDVDEKEREATEYGLHLLTGFKDPTITSRARMTANTLALAALRYARQNNIDPGHVVLNYGHTMDRMKLSQAALKMLPDQYSAPEYITEVLNQKIDWDLLPEDSKDILGKLM